MRPHQIVKFIQIGDGEKQIPDPGHHKGLAPGLGIPAQPVRPEPRQRRIVGQVVDRVSLEHVHDL